MYKLNDKQQEAVNTLEGPVIVIAGAGSGKTSVLTNRIVKLLENGVYDRNILAITFTNKAAREMKERTNAQVENRVFISTFHSLCFRLIRENKARLHYQNEIQVLDDDDFKKLLNEINKNNNLDIDFKKDFTYNDFTNYYVNKRYYGIVTLKFHHKQFQIEKLYDEYVRITKRDGLLNFEDLLYLTVEMLKENPDLLAYYQDKFKYILVDEYQDTNDIQNDLIIMLAKKHRNLFVVGDEDQSIYAFRGANLENLKNLTKVFKDTKIIKLEQNYRSTKPILEVANSVIKHNEGRIEKNLWTNQDSSEKVKYYEFDEGDSEGLFITTKIKELVNKGVNYNDIAILYRSGYIARNVERSLRNSFIPYITYGGYDFYKRIHIKNTINYLNVIMNLEGRYNIMQVINYPSRKIGPKALEEINLVLDNNSDKSIKEIFMNAKDYYSPSLAKKISDFYLPLVKLNEEIDSLDKASDIIDLVLDRTGLMTEFKTFDDFKERLDDVYTLKDSIDEWDSGEVESELSNREIIAEMLEETAAIYSYENQEDDKNRVVLSTMHMAKGLEFDYVFLPYFDDTIFPSRLSLEEGDKGIEEERRLCYVAVTRAKKELFISHAACRYMFGHSEYYQRSRFFKEMDQKYIENMNEVYARPSFKPQTKNSLFTESGKSSKTYEESKKPLKMPSNKKELYKVGDKVEHKIFGLGMVVEANGDILKIAFSSPHGIKTLMAPHPSFKKVE